MMRVCKTTILAALLLAGISSCGPKQAKPEMIYVDVATRSHFAFQPGSYWIYRDSLSGRLDSCYVKQLDSSMAYFDNDRKIGQMIQSRILQYATVGASDSIIYRWQLKKGLLQLYYSLPGNFIISGSGIPFSYPFSIGRIWGVDDTGYTSEITPLYALKGNAYNDALQGYVRFNQAPDQYTKFVINDSVGIIKIAIRYKTIHYIWELERCKIVK